MKRKNNRDKKRGDKGEDDGGFNIDDIQMNLLIKTKIIRL